MIVQPTGALKRTGRKPGSYCSLIFPKVLLYPFLLGCGLFLFTGFNSRKNNAGGCGSQDQ